MSKLTQKQLISQIRELKEIKPNKEWAVLLKSQIFAEKQVEEKIVIQPAKTVGIMDIFSAMFFQKKLVYSFASLSFFIVGLIGFAQYTVPGDLLFPIKKASEQSGAALTRQTALRQNVTTLNSRINDLAQVAKAGKTSNLPSAISEVNERSLELAKNLQETSADSQILKEIISSHKTLADIPGADLNESQATQDLLEAVITDYKKITLTDDQKTILTEAEDLYKQEKYNDAWEKIYSIQQANVLP